MQSRRVEPVEHHNKSSARRGSNAPDHRKPSGAWSVIERTGGILVIVALVIGPILVGSYFHPWQWPVVIVSAVGALLLASCSRLSRSHNWWLLLILAWPVIQGVWMWYNAWGEFHRMPSTEAGVSPWHILVLENQPFPSLPGGADRAVALDKLCFIIPCLGLVWGTRQLVISRPSWCQKIAVSIFWTGVAVALLGLIQRGTGAEGIYWIDELTVNGSTLFFGTFRSPGIATCYLNVALAFGLSTILTVLRKKASYERVNSNRKLLHLLGTTLGVIVIICAVIIAGSKAGMALGVFVVFLWIMINRRSITTAFQQSSNLFSGNKRTERNIVLAALLCILALSLLSLAGVMTDRWQSAHDQDYSTLTGRMQANEVIMKMVSDDSWGALGHGPGAFYPLFPYFTEEHGEELRGVWVYAHNDYLQTLLEWGWLGGLCFAFTIGGGVLLVAREVFLQRLHHSKTRFLYLRGYLLAMLAFLIHAAVDFPFQIESLAILFSIMLGVAWSVVDLRGREIRSRPKKSLT